MWLLFALLAPLFFAVVFVIDEYWVGEVFEYPWIGVITSSITTLLLVFLSAPYLLPIFPPVAASLPAVLSAMIAGCIVQGNQYLYFHALARAEAWLIAAFWNMVPALVPIVRYTLFGERLSFMQYGAMALLVGTSVALCVGESHLRTHWRSFVLILCASWLQVIAILFMDVAVSGMSSYQAFLFFSAGLVASGLLPLLYHKILRIVTRHMPHIKRLFYVLVLAEIVNLLAYGNFQIALKYGTTSIVSAIEATTPAFTLLVAALLSTILPLRHRSVGSKKILYRTANIGLMSLAVWMLSH